MVSNEQKLFPQDIPSSIVSILTENAGIVTQGVSLLELKRIWTVDDDGQGFVYFSRKLLENS